LIVVVIREKESNAIENDAYPSRIKTKQKKYWSKKNG